jgi:hypothetical protein
MRNAHGTGRQSARLRNTTAAVKFPIQGQEPHKWGRSSWYDKQYNKTLLVGHQKYWTTSFAESGSFIQSIKEKAEVLWK